MASCALAGMLTGFAHKQTLALCMTPHDVAAWMLAEVEKNDCLPQLEAAAGIASEFGTEFLYKNGNGRTAISRAVLKEFRVASEGTVDWERTTFCWRKRAADRKRTRAR